MEHREHPNSPQTSIYNQRVDKQLSGFAQNKKRIRLQLQILEHFISGKHHYEAIDLVWTDVIIIKIQAP